MARNQNLRTGLDTAFSLVFLLCAIKTLEWITNISLAGLGIWPRTLHGLIGILFSPLLHGHWPHLFANAIPLYVLMVLLFWDRRYRPAPTLSWVWFGSGLGTWLIGRAHSGVQPMVHIGASSIIYGLTTYLILAGCLMRSWRSAFIAILVFLLYGGIFFGVLPQSGPVSWEGHLSGAIAGAWAAWRNCRR